MQSKPVWIGDLGIRPKNQNFDSYGLKIMCSSFFFYQVECFYLSLHFERKPKPFDVFQNFFSKSWVFQWNPNL
jgi:hypothetical protein